MINRLKNKLLDMKISNRKAFIPYTMLGDNDLSDTMKIIDLYIESGASAIEIGIPFSDPVADGPTIQAAGIRALSNQYSMKDFLSFLNVVSEKYDVPLIIMTYLNPIINFGIPIFLKALHDANINGLIVPDLPIEEWDILEPYIVDSSLALVPLVTLTTSNNRLSQVCSKNVPFIYMVTFNGITGSKEAIAGDISSKVGEIKLISQTPIIAGFGISNTEQIRSLNTVVDGVIVASELIRLKESNNYSSIKKLIADNTGLQVV